MPDQRCTLCSNSGLSHWKPGYANALSFKTCIKSKAHNIA